MASSSGSLIVIEGANNVLALLHSGRFSITRILVEGDRHSDLVSLAMEKEVDCRQVGHEEMSLVAGYDFHRGVIAEAVRPETGGSIPEAAHRIVILEDLADAANIGAIVRTAVAFGVDCIVLEKGKGADPFSRKSIRASSTGIFRVPLVEVESLAETAAELSREGFRLVGTSLGENAVALRDWNGDGKLAVLFGKESDGLTREISTQCSDLVTVPMAGRMDSLNVAASAAIVLYELFGRRGV